jgi:DNA-binding NtrC family response regulator
MTAGPSVLIVNADEASNERLQRFLSAQGLEVQAITSVVEAWKLVQQPGFSVLLTDLFEPHHEGLSLMRYVHDVAPATRVVILGSCVSSKVRQRAEAAGAYAMVDTSCDLHHLCDILLQAMAAKAL